MKKLIAFALLAVLIFAIAGGAVWISNQGYDPYKFVRDAVTGFQSGHPRHQVSAAQAIRWDPIGDHNAAVEATPVGERAFPVLAEYAGRVTAMRDDAWGNPGGYAPDFVTAEPGDPEWPALVAWLEGEDAHTLTRLITEAAARPSLGQPLSARGDPLWDEIVRRHGGWVFDDPSPPPAHPLLYNVLLPSFGPATGGLTVLDARARLAVERNDREGLIAAVQPMIRMAELAGDPPFIISQMVAARFRLMARKRIAAVLSERPELVDEPTAELFDGWLALGLEGDAITPDATWELIYFEDILRRMVNDRGVFVPSNVGQTMDALDDGDLDAPPPSTAPLAAFNADLVASQQMLIQHTASGLAGLEIPWAPIEQTNADLESWVKQPDSVPGQIGRRLVALLLLDWQRPVETLRKARQDTLGLRTALAAHRHQIRHGRPPSSLDAIDPDLLGFDPIDGFTGGRLVYRWTGESHLVYALGADHDDDAGRHALDPDGEPVPFISDDYLAGRWDGDWVVFPPRE